MPIRIAIADDHAIVSHGIKRLLDGEPERAGYFSARVYSVRME